ncbi:helix-turn-helix transcriptional regulator [Actinomadura graeca]|uniref:Helix-turn-helix transcriptional regulator n=1 Tax=Actinomadura graeca TaxID=2750812 RepID=A0ABX8QU90_9ACTN|nr:helix-turn-helix transcriptional regulator [Actinomadura graeca]QXJ22386.1 helix-turn-helix transcriptional regulator [Actinomadura graeca]
MHLSAHDQNQTTALLSDARHEILSLVPSWHAPLRNAYLRARTRTRIVISRDCRIQGAPWPGTSEVRLGDLLSTFVLVVDRKKALVRNGDGALGAPVVRPSDLDRLIASFEEHWDRSYPITPIPARLSELQLTILRQLATGMTDQATANALKISSRTVQRQVSHVMEQLGARSRLELGVYLASTRLI